MNTQPQRISDTVQLEWLYDDKVFMHTMLDSKRDSVDAYINSNLKLIRNWDVNKPLMAIQNISSDKVTLTPYLRGRVGELAAAIREKQISGYSAIILPDNLMMRVFSFFGRLLIGSIGSNFQQQYFLSIEAGKAWIEEKIEETYATNG